MLKRKIEVANWSIKVFKTDYFYPKKPNDYEFHEPTLTALDVTDVPAGFIADPFIVSYNSRYFMFFEIYNNSLLRGEIGLATSGDGEKWRYEKVILKEKYHLSYPHVFNYKNQFYMVPESVENNGVFLYKAKNFPYEWERVSTLIEGEYFDATVFQYNGKWWMMAASTGELHLFFSEKLDGKWKEHPKSPLIENDFSISRPAGRVIISGDSIFRFTQDNSTHYGKLVRSFTIKKLSETEYVEEERKVILKGSDKDNDWRKDGMHHIDQIKINKNEWLIAVDGNKLAQENYMKWKMKRLLGNPLSEVNRMFKGYLHKIANKLWTVVFGFGIENPSFIYLGL